MDWFNRYPWLGYSEKLQVALCRYCVIFSNNIIGKGTHQQLGVLIVEAFTKWKNSIQHFNDHSKLEYHKL